LIDDQTPIKNPMNNAAIVAASTNWVVACFIWITSSSIGWFLMPFDIADRVPEKSSRRDLAIPR